MLCQFENPSKDVTFNRRIVSGKHLKAITRVDYPADITKTCEQFLAIFVYIQIVSGKYFRATSSVVYLV